MGCIYLVTNKINGKQYIGRTVKMMVDRRRTHEKDTNKGSHFCFHRALCKYGFDAFVWEEIHSDVPDEDLNKLEIECIKRYNSKAPNGYNLTDGGDGVCNPCQETIAKMSAAAKGRTFSEETRAKLSKANKDRIFSEETRAKLSKAGKGRVFSEIHKTRLSAAGIGKNKGRVLSKKTRARMSIAQTGHMVSEETKAKISAANRGYVASEETRAKLSAASKGRVVSEETKAKLRGPFTETHKANLKKAWEIRRKKSQKTIKDLAGEIT